VQRQKEAPNVYRVTAPMIAITGGLLLAACGRAAKPDFPHAAVPLRAVRLTDDFWALRMDTNRTMTIPHVFQQCEEKGRMDNFAVAAGLMEGEQQGNYPFDDTDVYKSIEGAAYCLMLHPDPGLEAYIDSLVVLIGAAQEPDGYLYTARTNNARRLRNWFRGERWENIERSHELYNAGHLFESATAYYLATGKRDLLDIALRVADLVDRDFGPDALRAPPGHEVVEMGLVKLYRVTGERRYLELAKFFLDMRGRSLDGRRLGGEYNQDHKPIVEQDEAVGHAVRAAYLYAGIADVAALTDDAVYLAAVDRLWEDVIASKLYITGGIGASGSGEALGARYQLPNMSAYNETCAAIGNVFWNHRMFQLLGNAKYIDVMERALYNGFLAGISLDGRNFFYPNPLESVGQHQRTPWFYCACCPPNVTRLIASVPGYFYATQGNSIYVNLFASGEARIDIPAGTVRLVQETRYPWDGRINITVEPERRRAHLWNLMIRIPGWARDEPVSGDLYRFTEPSGERVKLTVNGRSHRLRIHNGYVKLRRRWRPGDTVTLTLPMPVRRIKAHEAVQEDRGKVALQRGPIVYCLEWPDTEGGHVRNLLLPDAAELAAGFEPDLLGGMGVVKGEAVAYMQTEEGETIVSEPQKFTAIPYYAWAHRGQGEMTVWLSCDESAVRPLGLPTLASTSSVAASYGTNPTAVNDLLEPKSSIDHEVPFFHWWPHKGTTEWIQYEFEKPEDVSIVEVYWFDDTGRGECRPPASWRILYRDGDTWRPVWTEDTYGVEKDTWNRVVFETVRTTAVRLEIESQPDWAGGIHEWRIR